MDQYKMFYQNTQLMNPFTEYHSKNNGINKEIDKRLDYRVGSIVRYFKRDILSKEQKANNGYLYKIITFGTNNQTGELMVVFMGLYGSFSTFIEPIDIFSARVNKQEYPDIQQEYRYEVIKYQTDNGEGVY